MIIIIVSKIVTVAYKSFTSNVQQSIGGIMVSIAAFQAVDRVDSQPMQLCGFTKQICIHVLKLLYSKMFGDMTRSSSVVSQTYLLHVREID